MLEAERIQVRYGARTVVRDVSLRVGEGEWWMLIGPNGAGKSSLVGAIAQTVPSTGRICLLGQELRALRPRERARLVGVLAQERPAAYAYTVEEVVRLGRYAHSGGFLRHRDSEGQRDVDEALELTGMTAYRHTSMLALSGGEAQRAFLAQVLAQNPRLLILDEPANHLDLPYQQRIFEVIGAWLRQPGRAVLSVAHDLTLARRFATHALLMNDGVCLASGPAETVFTPGHLNPAYGMDVPAWLRTLYEPWVPQGDAAPLDPLPGAPPLDPAKGSSTPFDTPS